MSDYSVLIVDDHPVVQTCLSELFSNKEGFVVSGKAGSFADAVRQLNDSPPDLAVIDISIPGGSGLDLLKQFSGKTGIGGEPVKFLVLSAHDEKLLAPRSRAAGARGYLGKHASLEEVWDAVVKIMAGGLAFPMADELELEGDQRFGIDALSNRELQIFEAIGRGERTSEIAGNLGLSAKTIESHKENIKHKLRLSSAHELLRHAVQWQLERAETEKASAADSAGRTS